MTRAEQLVKVKQSLNVTGTALDDTLGGFMDDIELYMSDAGVDALVLVSDKAIGAISRGVSDMWINGELSQYFYQRVGQLSFAVAEQDGGV